MQTKTNAKPFQLPGLDSFQTLPLDLLFVDRRYQRPPDVVRIGRMEKDPNAALVGVVTVNDRGADAIPRYAIMDGQQRSELLRRLKQPTASCQVHVGLTPKEEAWVYVEMNRKGKKPTGIQSYIGLRFWGEDLQVNAIERITAANGWVVDNRNARGVIRAVGGLYEANRLGELDRALKVVNRAWGDATVNDGVIAGIAIFFERHQGTTPMELAAAITAQSWTSKGLKQTAVGPVGGGQMPVLIANLLDEAMGFAEPPVKLGRRTRVEVTTSISV